MKQPGGGSARRMHEAAAPLLPSSISFSRPMNMNYNVHKVPQSFVMSFPVSLILGKHIRIVWIGAGTKNGGQTCLGLSFDCEMQLGSTALIGCIDVTNR
jgi:hypothetical protein